MKKIILIINLVVFANHMQAQILNKIKQKAEKIVTKPADKPADNPVESSQTENSDTDTQKNNQTAKTNTENQKKETVIESDFIPGNTVLYFDNFEKEKNGDTPAGWITTTSAEVTGLDGLTGKWLKLFSTSTSHFTRNKKQSWGTEFTIEFDLIIQKNDYDPRIYFALINTKGNLVTDEKILQSKYYSAYVSAILGDGGSKTRVSLSKDNDINKSVSDAMSEKLLYTNGVPVHISISVQGKRFRFWWGNYKVYDAQIINQQYVPNQFGIEFGPVGGSDFYISNIRIAKDIPATRSAIPASTKNNDKPVPADENNTNPINTDASTPLTLKLQSKVLNIELPYAQIMKTGNNTFTFSAGKEEGNYKENYFKINLQSTGSVLKAETYNFKEINEKQPLYGTKQYPEIVSTQAVLYYGTVKIPYIYKFSPIIANAPYASFVSADLERKLPAPSIKTKFVIEKVENGKASGYFIFGMMNQGLKPVTKGDAMTETFTDGFIGEVKCTFSNIPVY